MNDVNGNKQDGITEDIGGAVDTVKKFKNANKVVGRAGQAAKSFFATPMGHAVLAVLGTIAPFFVLVFLILFMLFFIAAPLNAVVYSVEAGGEALTSSVDSVGQDLTVARYDFMNSLYEFTNGLEDFAYHLLHPFQAQKTDEIIKSLESAGIPQADDELFPEYTNATNSLLITLDAAFRKGWARTLTTAEYRASLIQAKSSGEEQTDKQSVIDKYDDETTWDSEEDFWSDESNWKAQDDYYRAGTYSYTEGVAYKGEHTGQSTQIIIKDSTSVNVERPSYVLAELKLIALQNSAEQSIITNSSEDGKKQFGISTDYSDGENRSEVEIASTEYQLLRLAGEVAGRGIQEQDLSDKNHKQEGMSIYQIVTTTTYTPEVKTSDVQRGNITGYNQKEVKDENGNVTTDPKTGKAISEPDYDSPIVDGWTHDHYDVWVEVTVSTGYHVELRPDAKEMIIKQMTENYSDDEKSAFNSAVNDYYPANFEILCKMYEVTDVPGGSGTGDGDYEGYVPVIDGFCWPLPAGVGGWVRGFTGASTSAHAGIDWWCPAGTPIFAAADGVVIESGYHYSWGNHVKIQHQMADGQTVYTLYAHMISAPSVASGQLVHQGDVIGHVGMTGEATGYHLHLELYVGGSKCANRVDPTGSFPVPAH